MPALIKVNKVLKTLKRQSDACFVQGEERFKDTKEVIRRLLCTRLRKV